MSLLLALGLGLGQQARAQVPTDIDFTDLGSPLAGTIQSGVTTGDFDGDGDPDLLLTGDGENGATTTVYDNQDNDGTLTAGDLQTVGTDHDDLYDLRRSGVSSGNLDGDGNLEVLLAGEGGFEGTAQLETATIFEVTADGDLTNDDFSVVADSTTSDLVGVWGAPRVITKMTDLDGDGDLDLIINGLATNGTPSSEITRVYENTDTNGAFGAEDISFVETGLPDGNVGTLSLGDLDKDGDPDLVVGGNGSVQIFENTSTGSLGPDTFVEVANTSNSDLIALDFPASALGDLDDDGDSDLVINGQDPNQSTRQLSLVYDNTDTDGDLTTGDFEEVRAPNGDRPLDGLTSGTLLLEDFDENGTLDILQSGPAVGNLVTEIYENEDANNTLEADDLSKRSNSLVGFQTGVISAAADFNGDGDADVLLNGATQNLSRVAKIYRNLSETGITVDGQAIESLYTKIPRPDTANGFGSNDLGALYYHIDEANENLYVATAGTLQTEEVFGTLNRHGIWVNVAGGSSPPQGVPPGEPLGIDASGDFQYINASAGDYRADFEVDFMTSVGPSFEDPDSLTRAVMGDHTTDPSSIVEFDTTDQVGTPVSDTEGLGIEYAYLNRDTDSTGAEWKIPFSAIGASSGSSIEVFAFVTNNGAYFSNEIIPGNGAKFIGENISGNNDGNVGTNPDWSTLAAEYNDTYHTLIGGGNVPPTAADDSFATPAGQTLTVNAPGVLGNDTDPNGNSLSASLVSDVSDGSLTLDADGSFEYTPNSGFVGQDAFTYEASDGNVSDTADVVVSVTGEVQGLTITSFRPQSGVPGSQIRIYGSGFDPAPENNTVTVGGTTAAVDSAGSNVLYVTVPAGASGPLDLSVSTEGTTATAAQPFTSITGGAELFADAQAELVNVSRGDVDWGDYNGDGRLDVAVTGSDEARIYRNEGDGTFTDIQAGLTGVGEDTSVEWGDYNNDGALDLAVLGNSNGSGTTTIYRNDGNGTFTDIDAGLIGLIRGSVDWGDYNRNGRLDIVVTGFDDDDVARTRIYRNDGGGTFTSINAGLQGVFNSSAEWGDYNGDGRLDLIVTGSFSATIYRNDGEGAFTDIGAGLTGVNFGTSASWGDYNRDGRLDVVVTGADPNGGTTTLYRNDGNDTFTAVNAGLTDVEQGDVAWGNFTGDGALDLVVTGRDENDNATATLYRNEGGGSFMAVDAGLSGVTFSAQAGGDFDGDGTLDLLVTGSGGSTTVYENQGSGAGNSPPTAADDNFSTPQGQTLTVEAPGVLENDIDPDGDSLTASLVENTSDGSLAFDADGSFEYTPDAEFLGQDAFTYEAIDDSSAADTATVSIDVVPPGGPPAFTQSGAGLEGVRVGSVAWLDADGDGDQDLLVTGEGTDFGETTILYENDGSGGLTPTDAGLADVEASSIDVADIEGDGDPDLVITGFGEAGTQAVIYENDGTGTFSPVGAGLTGVAVGSSTFGDFDQDGDPDLVITGRGPDGNATATVYENDGTGGFTAVGAGLEGVRSGSSTDWADIDEDGDLDLVVTGGVETGGSTTSSEPEREDCRVGGSRGDRAPSSRPVRPGPEGCAKAAPRSHQTTATTTIYENQGDGTFAPVGAGLTGVEAGAARFGDADGDGVPDLVVTGESEESGRIATLYENDGNGNFTAAGAGLTPVGGGASVEWADLRGDGDQDLIVTGFGQVDGDFGRTARIYENDGTGDFSALETGLIGVSAGASAAADADGDGDVDLAAVGFDELTDTPSTRVYVNRRLQEGPNRSPQFARSVPGDTIAAGLVLEEPVEAGDPDGDALDLQLTSGAANASLLDNGNGTGRFVFEPDTSQLGQTFSFTLEASDGRGGTAASSFTIRVPSQFAAFDTDVPAFSLGSATLGDFDQDGDQDLVFAGGGETTIFENDGQGNLTPIEAGLLGVGFGSSSDWGDFDQDGDLDLVISGSSTEGPVAAIYENEGNGTFTRLQAGLSGVSRSSVNWMDADGDSDLDLLVAGEDETAAPTATLYENQDGTFTPLNAGLTGTRKSASDVADVDGDGDQDLVLTGVNVNGPSSTLYLNDGQGNFTAAETGLTGVEFGSSDFGDFDQDGDPDLVITGSFTTTLYENNGQGSFTPMEAGLADVRFGSSDFGDVDQDGDLDLVITGRKADPSEPSTRVYENTDQGEFARLEAGLLGVEAGTSEFGDVDRDGDPDLAVLGDAVEGGSEDTGQLYENLIGGDDQQCPLAWSFGVSGSDVSGDSISVTFGQSAAATAGIDPACGEEEQPPKPPSDVFDLRFTGTDLPGIDLGEGLVRDIRPTDTPTPAPEAESAPAIWRLEVQSENYPVTLTWDNAALADSLPNVPVRLVDVVTGGDLVDVNMKQVGSYTLENSSVTALEIRLDRALTREVPIAAGWNLLSVPLEAADPTFGAVLPPCQSGFFFDPGTGYQPIADGDTVSVGRGLFANCSAGTAQITGQAPAPTIEVAQGWNIIGPLADSVDVDAITSDPPGIVVTDFFGFDQTSGYQNASTLGPGSGYWVKTGESGVLDLSGSSGGAALASTQSASAAQEQPGAQLRLTDAAGRTATLRLAKDVSEQRLQRAALPPVPPGGAPDVRFEGGQSVAETKGDNLRAIETQGLKAPVTIKLTGAEGGQSIRLRHGGETTRLTAESPSAKLSSTEDLAVGLQAAPEEFALKKTYPNPSSGRTTVEYAVPKQADVTIAVYDVLGRRVATLADGPEEPGRHTARLDAGQMPSGIYFVRMRAKDFQQTRRLTVVR